MWRTTPMHRDEIEGSSTEDGPPALPTGIDRSELQMPGAGAGPLFHRRYRTRIRETALSPEELIERISVDLNRVCPSEFATFQKVRGEKGLLLVDDEFVVRMPGPWDGPVRVVEVTPASFRLATLDGHLEAGQIEFRAVNEDGLLVFAIESWARSADWLTDLLYDRLRMSKEVQLHMWTSTLERAAKLAGGRITGGLDIETRKVEAQALGR
jgi:hypothetical protein